MSRESGPRVATIHLTRLLAEVAGAEEIEVPGTTLAEVLEGAFAASPRLRGYVVDEQGRIRKHVAVFVDGLRADSEQRPDQAVEPDSEVHILPALSGG